MAGRFPAHGPSLRALGIVKPLFFLHRGMHVYIVSHDDGWFIWLRQENLSNVIHIDVTHPIYM